MALERIGIGAVVTFDASQAVRGMGQVQKATVDANGRLLDARGRFVAAGQSAQSMGGAVGGAAAQIKSFADRAGASVQALGNNIRNVGLALSGFTVAVGFATKQSADFEQAQANVQAVALKSASGMKALRMQALRFGATTKFTASQASEAQEIMTRAGFTEGQVLKGLGGILNAAAADGITLQQSADSVTGAINGMGLTAADTTRVADVMAMASSKTAANVVSLGRALTYVAPTAKAMGLSFEDTVAALGLLHDAGLKGTMAGTSMANMFIKLAKPSQNGAKYMKEFGIVVARNEKGNVDLVKTLESARNAMMSIRDPVKRIAVSAEVFGIRGQKAASAFASALTKPDKSLAGLIGQLENSKGAAEKMADVRLNTVYGQFTLLQSAVEGFSIAFGHAFLGGTKGAIKAIAKVVGDVGWALTLLNEGIGENDKRWRGLSPTAIAVAKGIRSGIQDVTAALGVVKKVGLALFNGIFGSLGKGSIKTIARVATVFVLVAAAMGPVLAILGTIVAFIGSALIPVIGAVAVIGAKVFGVAILGAIGGVIAAVAIFSAAIAAVVGTFVLLQRKGETVGQTLTRIFGAIKAAIVSVINYAVVPFAGSMIMIVVPAVQKMWKVVMSYLSSWRQSFQGVITSMVSAVMRLAPIFQLVFSLLGRHVGKFIAMAAQGFIVLFHVITPVLETTKQVAKYIIEGVMNGLIKAVQMVISLADKIGAGGMVAPELRQFVKGGRFEAKLPEQTVKVAAPKFNLESLKSMFGLGGPSEYSDGTPGALDARSRRAGLAAAGANVKNCITLDDKRTTHVKNHVSLDGREIGHAAARQKQDVDERNGFKTTPFQRRTIVEQGATTVPGGRL